MRILLISLSILFVCSPAHSAEELPLPQDDPPGPWLCVDVIWRDVTDLGWLSPSEGVVWHRVRRSSGHRWARRSLDYGHPGDSVDFGVGNLRDSSGCSPPPWLVNAVDNGATRISSRRFTMRDGG